MPRFIHKIFTSGSGSFTSNKDLLLHYQAALDNLILEAKLKQELQNAIKYFLMGQRARRGVDGWLLTRHFQEKATAFEQGIEQVINSLATQISQTFQHTSVIFDAVITVSSTGNVMPSISYRFAHRLPDLIPSDCLMIDFGNVGCTGGMKALNLVNSLDKNIKNILLVTIEAPSTLVNLQSARVDVWQGNCTFGDGAAALWISSEVNQGQMALELEQIYYAQKAQHGLNLIHWGYQDYYSFELADEKTFNRDVQTYVLEALENTRSIWQKNSYWAIHPAGIAILLKLSRKLNFTREALAPSIAHYETYSNMSSASIMYILKSLAEEVAQNQAINLLSMGAGFNVIYGCVRKVR